MSPNNENNTSITMNLANLQKKYSNLLSQYESAVYEYNAYLKSQKPSQLVSIKGQAFNGTGSAGESKATTLNECIASCSNSKTCTGATFISNKCVIRTGDSPIIPSSENSYAIIPKSKQLLLNINDLNEQLLDVNKKILNQIKKDKQIFHQKDREMDNKNDELISVYEKLLDERIKIDNLIDEYETLENTDNENQILINKNYYTYILLFILAILIIVFLYKMVGTNVNPSVPNVQYGGKLGINAYCIILILVLLVISILYYNAV